MKNTIDSLILENMNQLSHIPTILKRIEKTEYMLLRYKNTMIRFYKEKRVILLNEVTILKSFKVKQMKKEVLI